MSRTIQKYRNSGKKNYLLSPTEQGKLKVPIQYDIWYSPNARIQHIYNIILQQFIVELKALKLYYGNLLPLFRLQSQFYNFYE